jgi:hypothetical protein
MIGFGTTLETMKYVGLEKEKAKIYSDSQVEFIFLRILRDLSTPSLSTSNRKD